MVASPIAILLFGMIALTHMESLALILLSAIDTILFVVFSDYINKQIPSQQRNHPVLSIYVLQHHDGGLFPGCGSHIAIHGL